MKSPVSTAGRKINGTLVCSLVMVKVVNALVVPTLAVKVCVVPGDTSTGGLAVPVRLAVCGLFGALSTTLSVAVLLPVAAGANVRLIWQVCPAGSEFGAVGQVPPTVKSFGSAPAMPMVEMISGMAWLFVSSVTWIPLVCP